MAARCLIILLCLLYAGSASAEVGFCSWYGTESGSRTANGERFDGSGMTAAHRSLPFNTMVRVTVIRSGKSVVVRINDRGPFAGGRIIDLSRAAAVKLGIIRQGVARVRVEKL